MIGLPGQTTDHLVRDLRFFEEFDLDMIGMGPYIPHADTPLGKGIAFTPEYMRDHLEKGLRMIACTRLLLKDVAAISSMRTSRVWMRIRSSHATGLHGG